MTLNEYASALLFLVLSFFSMTLLAFTPACPSQQALQKVKLANVPSMQVGQLVGEDTWTLATGPDATMPFLDGNNLNKKRMWLLTMSPFPSSYEKNQVIGVANQMLSYAPVPFQQNAFKIDSTGIPTWLCIYTYPDTPGPIKIIMMSYDEDV